MEPYSPCVLMLHRLARSTCPLMNVVWLWELVDACRAAEHNGEHDIDAVLSMALSEAML